MKKMMMLALASVILAITACGANANEKFTATDKGAGPVELGMAIADLPAACDGLYDALTIQTEENEWEDAHIVICFSLADTPVMYAYSYDNKTVEKIEIYTSAVSTTHGIAPQMKVSTLFDAGGTARMTNDGQIVLVVDGVVFTGGNLTDAAGQKITEAYQKGLHPQIEADDFAPDATLMSIRIGF